MENTEVTTVLLCVLMVSLLGLYWKLGVDNECWYVNDITKQIRHDDHIPAFISL